MKTLVIGDSHLKLSILEDARFYIAQLLRLIQEGNYAQVILLGDQFDTFAVVRSEVLSLWTKFFREASQFATVIALVGNHDMAGADGGANPMEPFNLYENVWIVSAPNSVSLRGVYFIPFIRDNKKFEEECLRIPAGAVLVCHQSFDGARFENGFYDPHGADPKCVAHLAAVISGHVHLEQAWANIWYPGTPFQQSFGESDSEKRVFTLDLTPSGYNILESHKLGMPRFVVLRSETLEELKKAIQVSYLAQDQSTLARSHFKLIAQGTPAEIAEFWNDPEVKEFKRLSKRVVDALTSMKPQGLSVSVQGKTQKEKLHEYVRTKKWRTEPNLLTHRAEELLTS
jgi:DNA repair exonuclease SbcCD nuclease subunit